MLITQRSTFMDCVSITLAELLLGAVRATAHGWSRLTQASNRARQRRQLRELDARLLRDIGLTHSDVHAELRKPLWVE